MSRSERNQTQVNPFLKIKIVFLIMLFVGLMVITNIYLNGIIRIETPEVDLGRKVVVHLEDGKEVQTYENLLVKKKGKLYYQGEFNTIDVTGGIVVFQDWD
ncbi:hypothetical protein [Bacillus sp. 1NLA3E]|uniref:hypothetical protein n=1 Tax=Bacillus sp. 1NLA3E TaxID=666686 RepID=UPI000247E9BB|nr:hypothetical protein [Bacillus sp. 1NLA3E]AGK53356.1 hypothetical protein B1NLA3E_07970 [Bacillus sp. 1NLA3E]